MMQRVHRRAMTLLILPLSLLLPVARQGAAEGLQLQRGDHICYIGNTMADRMQHHAWLETMVHASHPGHDLTFRNLGFSGDEIGRRQRSANFGDPNQWLTKCQADVVFCFFGYNEALRGSDGKELAGMIDDMRKQKYNGKSAPRLVVFSPIAHENLKNPHLPDGSANNDKLAALTAGFKEVCVEKDVTFIDLFAATQQLYASADKPLTMNGIHLLDHGNRAVAEVIVEQLFDGAGGVAKKEKELLKVREAVLDKNLHWFSRYRVVDGYNVYGGRSKLAWHGQSNADVMRREMEIFDVMTANRDKRIWAVAKGGDMKIDDSNIPKELEVKTNRPGKLEGGKYAYLGGKEAIEKLKIAEGMQVNLFASEEMFPELINPVQMAVDTNGHLFASVWPSYPHWNPTQPRTDRIVCLPDENGDGVADKCIVFADKLNSVTGFEFWGGGMLVFAPPEIWFLKDNDNDYKADEKIRMLQGISSADTHHSANAVVVGPDGWLYWSRGIFNVAAFETPTKTHRTGSSGVHRFNPRTFETEFHFPIGPNPHGDVIDQWGYQFANDGTGGTGCYVNIGKGQRNKQWFKKRVRPVPATGILSSSHFPERNNGNFLICNAIGFLGVLQHEVKYNGADITAQEIEPILVSADPNFRPTDVEIGGDGALYVSDWANALIGHMQHNMRDPNRDHAHGRIYRVTYQGRPLVKPVRMKGQPIETVCGAFYAKENSTRYRARLELSGRDTDEVTAAVSKWAGRLDPGNADDAQALLECLWVFEEHRVPNLDLLKTVVKAAEPRVRAAAIRTLGHWAGKVEGWEPVLIAAARDEAALVRAEAVKAAVEFQGLAAAEVIFETAVRPTDPELDTVLNYARGKINADKIVQEAVNSGKPLSQAAQRYALSKASVSALVNMKRSDALYQALLSRAGVPEEYRSEALEALAKKNKRTVAAELVAAIDVAESNQHGSLDELASMLSASDAAQLKSVAGDLQGLTAGSQSGAVRTAAYAAWITANGSGDAAWKQAIKSAGSLGELLNSLKLVSDQQAVASLYPLVRPLVFELPVHLRSDQLQAVASGGSGVAYEYYEISGIKDVSLETLAKMKPKLKGRLKKFETFVPNGRQDAFATKQTASMYLPNGGKYTFYTNSDDGSRLYIDKQLVVNNDGLHGMVEKSGSVDLSAGVHEIIVTYYDNGGGDGLIVSWSGPGIKKAPIPGSKLNAAGAETLQDVAIRTLSRIPGHEAQNFKDLAQVVQTDKPRHSAVRGMLRIPTEHWSKDQLGPLAKTLAAHISEIPARDRTGRAALDAMQLTDALAALLPEDEANKYRAALADLKVNVIRIGTVVERMIYDKERIEVQAGKPVEFIFTNTDKMPHNFAIVQPGALEEVGTLAEATALEPDAMQRHYIPRSDKILLASRLLQPGDTQAISYEAPTEPGIYPYVCTYPGHWRRMHGALYVVADLKEFLADRQGYLAKHPLEIKDELLKFQRNREWVFEDLEDSLASLHHGRSFEVGKQLFTVASCVSCHELNKQGVAVGPDLTKLDDKWQPVDLLREILEPSKRLNEKFQSHIFDLANGKIVTGLIVDETPTIVRVATDPMAKAPPIAIKKSDIEARVPSPISLMPKGLLDRLTREEILDLVAYVHARGNAKHKIFKAGHHHKN